MKVGRKLANKLLNVSKFVLGFGDVADDADLSASVTHPVDLSMLAVLDDVIDEATTAFEDFDYARALERTEAVFWWFCDNYVELVKTRAYGDDTDAGTVSARQALRTALGTLQRLLAPIQPCNDRPGMGLPSVAFKVFIGAHGIREGFNGRVGWNIDARDSHGPAEIIFC